MKEGLRDAVKGGITKVQARYDEAKYYCLARCRGEGVLNLCLPCYVISRALPG